MNIRMKRSAALILTAALLLAGSAQALFGLGKSKTDAPVPENAPAARDLEIRTYRAIEGEKEFYGILTAYDDKSVTIQPEEKDAMTFLKSDIALIRLAFDF